MGSIALGDIVGVGGGCDSRGRSVGVGYVCGVSSMGVALSCGVPWAGVVGEIVVGVGCIRGEGFQDLHCRRFS